MFLKTHPAISNYKGYRGVFLPYHFLCPWNLAKDHSVHLASFGLSWVHLSLFGNQEI